MDPLTLGPGGGARVRDAASAQVAPAPGSGQVHRGPASLCQAQLVQIEHLRSFSFYCLS